MKIALIGNASSARFFGPLIDSHDLVIRFNLTPYFGDAGYKTDVLCVSNTGFPARQVATGAVHLHPGAIANAQSIWLVADPLEMSRDMTAYDAERDEDFTETIRELVGVHKPVSALSNAAREGAKQLLWDFGAPPETYPSTGAVTLYRVLRLWPEAHITLFGFAHKGWNGHAWSAEQKWMNSLPNVERAGWRSLIATMA